MVDANTLTANACHLTTAKVGTVCELWRYSVSSTGGEALQALSVSAKGVSGDRAFCLFDPVTGLPAAPEKELRWRPAMFLRAYFDGAPKIEFPDGASIAVTDPEIVSRLTEHFGFSVHVGATERVSSEKTGLPFVVSRYKSSPLHLLTTASLGHLAEIGKFPALDSRRFRPTVLIKTATGQGFQENNWIGGAVRIGEVLLQATEGTKRCGMTLVPQPGILEDPEILRNILRHNKRNFGIYCDVSQVGEIKLGDDVYIAR